jgi:hypothetical protein
LALRLDSRAILPTFRHFRRPSLGNAKADQFKATPHFRTAEAESVDEFEALKCARAGIERGKPLPAFKLL